MVVIKREQPGHKDAQNGLPDRGHVDQVDLWPSTLSVPGDTDKLFIRAGDRDSPGRASSIISGQSPDCLLLPP